MTCAAVVGSISAVHAYAGMQNAWPKSIKFPRSDWERIARMNRYVDWKREKIAERRWRHLALFLAWTCAPPLVLTVIGLCWRVLLWVNG